MSDIETDAEIMTRTKVVINITPLFKQNNELVCSIEPPASYMKGGNIHLPQGMYTLEFALQPGNFPNIAFDTKQNGSSNGFWCDGGFCPTHETYDSQYSNPT